MSPSTNDNQELRWWLRNWWNDPDYVGSHTTEEVASAVDILKLVFTEQWCADALDRSPGHRFVRKLIAQSGEMIADSIIESAGIIKALKSAEGFGRKIEELKEERKFGSVYFELSIAELFASQGGGVQFPKEGKNKVPDIVISAGTEKFSVECKRLEREQWEDWESDLLRRLSMSGVMSFGNDETLVEIVLNQRLSELRMDDEDINEQIIVGVEKTIRNVFAKLADHPVGDWLSMQGVGKIRKTPKEPGKFSHVSGFAISPVAKLRRIMRNGLMESISQLQPEIPGMAAVYSSHPIDLSLAKIAFEAICGARPDKSSHLVGMMIQSGVPQLQPPALLINRNSKFDAMECEAVRMALSSKLKPTVI